MVSHSGKDMPRSRRFSAGQPGGRISLGPHENVNVEQRSENVFLGYNWTLVISRQILAWLYLSRQYLGHGALALQICRIMVIFRSW